MQIEYKNKFIEGVCTDAKLCDIKYGPQMTSILHQRIEELTIFSSIHELVTKHIGRCHPLNGNRKGQYAMDLVHPRRLIIEPYHGQIKIVQVDEIVDYH